MGGRFGTDARRGGMRVARACRHPAVLHLLRPVEAGRCAAVRRDVPEALRAVPGRVERQRGRR
jgi:hypothetical protein